jgi:malonyl-CoA/methylmalonyl-CoA synthetase
MSLLSLFDRSLIGRSASAALQCDHDGTPAQFTFGSLESRSNQTAHTLRSRGLQRGDRVAFFLNNRVEVIDLWIAAVKLGLVLVPINVLYRERELRHILSDAAPTAVVTSSDLAVFLPMGTEIWDVQALAQEAQQNPSERITVSCDAQTPLALIYRESRPPIATSPRSHSFTSTASRTASTAG